MADVQWYDESASEWKTIEQAMWRVENGVSSKMPAPRAVIETNANVDLLPNTDIRVRDGSDPIFVGYTRNGGEYGDRGQQRINCRSEAYKILNEEVSVSVTSGTDYDVLSDAVATTSRSADFSLFYPETPIDIGDYDATERKLKVILRDMADRTGRIWYFTSDANTLTIQSLGYRGTWETLETGTDNIGIEKWNGGEIDAVQNSITVTGTGSDPVTSDTIEDTNSIDKYGRQSASYSYRWIQTKTQANDLANQLLIPEPLESGKVTIPDTSVSGNTWENLSNYTIDLTDSTRGINSVLATIEKQVIQEGRTTLHVGKGVSYAESSINRNSQSQEDAVRTEYSQMGGTLDDIDDGVTYGKILQDGISSGYHLLNKAIGDLDNIDDGGTYARVREGNVDSDNYVLLATSVGDLDDIDDGTNYGRVLSTGIDAGKVTLAEAKGDLDNIEDGTDFGKVSTTNLTPGSAVFAKGVEIEDSSGNLVKSVQNLMSDDSDKNATVIDGNEIKTGTISATEISSSTITADEIDTLTLDSNTLFVDPSVGTGAIEFALDSNNDHVSMKPDSNGVGKIGSLQRFWNNGYFQDINVSQTAFLSDVKDVTYFEAFPPDSTTSAVVIKDDAGNVTFQPNTDKENRVGTLNNAWNTMRATAFNVASPKPLAQKDIEELGETVADGGKGKRPVDLDELKNSTWYDPPQYIQDEQQRNLESQEKGDEEDHAVELGHMGNYLFEVTKALAEERDELADRVDALESRLSKLEAQVGE